MASLTSAPLFVGRERELRELENVLEEAIAERGETVLISGEAGIGKTRLLEEFGRRTVARGCPVFWGRALDQEGAPPYWPWIELVSRILEMKPEIVLARYGDLAALSGMIPSLRSSTGRSGTNPAGEGASSSAPRLRFFDAMASLFQALAGERTVLFLLDDLHVADESSLLLLEHVTGACRHHRILLAGAYRDGNRRGMEGLRDRLDRLTNGTRRLTLSGLSRAEVRELVESVAGSKARPELVDVIQELTNGNPFFVEELVRSGSWPDRAGMNPVSRRLSLSEAIRALVRRRIDPLPGECRRVLYAASVFGRSFAFARLAEAMREDPTIVLEGLREAERVGLIETSPADEFRFSHGLVREALYDELLPGERMDLHFRVARAIEAFHGTQPEYFGELARHFVRAGRPGILDEAIRYCRCAGDHATRSLAWEDASGFYEESLRLLERVRGCDAERCETWIALATAFGQTGELERGREAFQRAARIARDGELPLLLGRAALGLGRLISMGYETFDPALQDRVVDWLEEALERLPPRETKMRVRILSALAVALHARPGSLEQRRVLTAQAAALAEDATQGEIATALAAKRFALWTPENLEERLEQDAQVLEAANAAGRRRRVLEVLRWKVMDHLEAGDVARAAVETDRHAREAEALGHPWDVACMALLRAMRVRLEGRFGELASLSEDALAAARRSGSSFLVQLVRAQQRIGALLDGDRKDSVLSSWSASMPEEWVPGARAVEAFFLAETGEEDRAREAFERIAVDDFGSLSRDLLWVANTFFLSGACVRLQDAARAERLLGMLRPFEARSAVLGPPPVLFLGPVSLELGRLAATAGRMDEAERYLQRSVDFCMRTGARPLLARSWLALAEVAASQDREDEALRFRREGRKLGRSLGLACVSERKLIPALDPAGPTRRPPGSAAEFRRHGSSWVISWAGRTIRLRHTKGLEYLHRLIAAPGTSVPARELEDGAKATARRKAPRGTREILLELDSEMAEAERFNDPGRLEVLRQRQETVLAAFSIRAETKARTHARSNVTKAIRATLRKIDSAHPELARYLRVTVRTGLLCSYRPDPAAPVSWRL